MTKQELLTRNKVLEREKNDLQGRIDELNRQANHVVLEREIDKSEYGELKKELDRLRS